MTTAATAAATNTFAGASTNITSSTSSQLGEGAFLDLMMDQLKEQDPLNPADPTQYMSELANFSALDEQMQIASSSSESAGDEAANAALNLVGKTVTYETDTKGDTASGTVTAVDFTSSGPTLTIGNTSGITLSAVTSATNPSS